MGKIALDIRKLNTQSIKFRKRKKIKHSEAWDKTHGKKRKNIKMLQVYFKQMWILLISLSQLPKHLATDYKCEVITCELIK